jgi:hypothetical protein
MWDVIVVLPWMGRTGGFKTLELPLAGGALAASSRPSQGRIRLDVRVMVWSPWTGRGGEVGIGDSTAPPDQTIPRTCLIDDHCLFSVGGMHFAFVA